MTNNEVEIVLEKQGDVTVFDIHGDVTALSEPFFGRSYEDASQQGTQHIVLKLYEKTYINSGGIAVLIQLLAKTKKNNQLVSITGISDHFKKIFNMVGITKFADIYDTLEEALNGAS